MSRVANSLIKIVKITLLVMAISDLRAIIYEETKNHEEIAQSSGISNLHRSTKSLLKIKWMMTLKQ